MYTFWALLLPSVGAAVLVEDALVPVSSRGVNSYSQILAHLTKSTAKYVSSPGEEVQVKDWAKKLGQEVSDMHRHFVAANSIAAQDKEVTKLQGRKKRDVSDIAVVRTLGELKYNARKAKEGLMSAERAVDTAVDTLNEFENKCGRKKRDVSDIVVTGLCSSGAVWALKGKVRNAKVGLENAERAVDSAEDKLNEAQNKCITGRKKRDVSIHA